MSGMGITLFLGGWHAPLPALAVVPSWVWFFLKLGAFIMFFIWLRGTLPRMRYDQFMRFGWKVLIPVSLAWIMLVGTTRQLRQNVSLPTDKLLIYGSILLTLGVLASYFIEVRADGKRALEEERRALLATGEFDPFAGGFPVPPMPGQQAQPSRLVRQMGDRE